MPLKSILTPMRIRMIPPRIPACDEYLSPYARPIAAPAKLSANVMRPMTAAGNRISSESMEMDTPAMSASMLVAIASVTMVTNPRSPSSPPSSLRLSRIMLRPMRNRIADAIHGA